MRSPAEQLNLESHFGLQQLPLGQDCEAPKTPPNLQQHFDFNILLGDEGNNNNRHNDSNNDINDGTHDELDKTLLPSGYPAFSFAQRSAE
eukprot:g38571.t1